MKAVIQRVNSASVSVENKIINSINKGLIVFLGIEKSDTKEKADYLIKKIYNLRIFNDSDNKMNLSLRSVNGEILIISQFTLCTDNEKSGNRPSFTNAEIPDRAEMLYDYFLNNFKKSYDSLKVFGGIFAAYMVINLINDGPVTIILQKWIEISETSEYV